MAQARTRQPRARLRGDPDHRLCDHLQRINVADGTPPAVCWIVPNGTVSEHAPGRVSAGQTYVTHLVNAIASSPLWANTAIFLAWDDWGGFYDHVAPPTVDDNGYGLRVPRW